MVELHADAHQSTAKSGGRAVRPFSPGTLGRLDRPGWRPRRTSVRFRFVLLDPLLPSAYIVPIAQQAQHYPRPPLFAAI